MEIISASSSLWLVKIMQRITADQEFITFLMLYLGSLLLPSIPWCLAFIFRTSWRQEAQREFIRAFVTSNKSNIAEWGNKGMREQKMSLLTSEGPQTLNNFIDYAFEVASYALSVFCNIIALSIVVEPLFLMAFSLSLLSVILIMKLRKRAQRQLTKKALTARIDLSQSLLGAWDNVLIGNDYNFQLWQERTHTRMNRCLQKNVDLERFDQIMAILVSLITMVPALIVVVYFVITYQGDKTKLASFFVTVPILFLILSYTYLMLGHAFRWGIHKSKLTCVYQAIQPAKTEEGEMTRRVKWPKIELTMNEGAALEGYLGSQAFSPATSLSSHHDIIQHTGTPGRITLRGENGSGKSTVLGLVKQSLCERAFLLPTHSHLNFTSEKNKYSTGETLKKRLVEILDKVEVDVLLLDEWDANLDKENRQILSDLIDQIAEVKCVIEVRHR
jgi:ABC-type transport system involved in cytochrome bd biosynthesis fused ATPase/permease subunit